MARRSVRAGYLSRRLEALRARGLTRGQIARETGIGERTQRKLASGDTSGARLFARQSKGATSVPRSSEPGHFALVVQNPDGSYRRIPVVLPGYARRKRLTPLDKAVILSAPGAETLVTAELGKAGPHGTAPWKPEDIATADAIDVVPITNAHTRNIPFIDVDTAS